MDNESVQVFTEWVEFLKTKIQSCGCFFIFGENIQPFFWGTPYQPEIPLEDAWDFLCADWLNKIYKYDLRPLFPHIIKGVVSEGLIRIGNDCPFYLDDIKFNFKLGEVDFQVDPSLAVDLNIPEDLAVMMRVTHKETSYFERLPAKIQFKKREYGPTIERSEAQKALVNKAVQKARRFGSLPSLKKP